MSYKYYFFDDQEVGAEDLNKLVKMFTVSGVADNFENGVPYNLSKLNDVITTNSSEGIVPESCDTLKVSTDAGFLFIEPGVAFFKDGTVIEIESREQFELPGNAVCYAYLKSDAQQNKAYPVLSEVLPENENTVPLARISETGEVADLRRFARGKVPSFYASSAGVRIENEFEITESSGLVDTDRKLTLIESGNSFRYLMILCQNDANNELGYYWATTLLYDTETNMCYNFSKPYNGDYTDDYTQISRGTSFRLMDCYSGRSHFILYGDLYFTDGKVELKISSKYIDAADSNFISFTYPFNMKVIAC